MKRRILYALVWGLFVSLITSILVPLYKQEEINITKTLITTVLFIAVGFVPNSLFMKKRNIDKQL